MNKYIFDFVIYGYTGCGRYQENVIRSIYVSDYTITKDGKVTIIKLEFSDEEINERKDELEAKARMLYNKFHKHPLGKLLGVRKVK